MKTYLKGEPVKTIFIISIKLNSQKLSLQKINQYYRLKNLIFLQKKRNYEHVKY